MVRLWEQSSSLFLQYPGLIPFATLGQTDDPEAALRQVAQAVNQISNPTMQANLTSASAILAGFKIGERGRLPHIAEGHHARIYSFSSIQAEAEARAEARTQREIALNFLRDNLPVEVVARGTGLSVEEVQQLQQQLNASPQT